MGDIEDYGYIYCMSNECMNGILKIGITKNNPLLRANQLYYGNTSIPCKFKIEFCKKVKNPLKVEQYIHNILSNKRYPRREFFKVTEEEVRRVFFEIDGEWWDRTKEDNQCEYNEPEDMMISEEVTLDNDNDNDNDNDDANANEPSDDEEDDPMVVFANQQKILLNKQKQANIKKHFDIINVKVDELRNEKLQLQERIGAIDTEIITILTDAQHKTMEENKAIQVKLDKILVYLGETRTQRTTLQPAQRKASNERIPRADGGLPYTKLLNVFRPDKDYDMCNTTTRFIFKMNSKKQCVSLCAYCLIDKSMNKIYECDENNKRIGDEFVSLNKFCYMVKARSNFGGSMKQNIFDSMKYYDKKTCQYVSLQNLTEPVN